MSSSRAYLDPVVVPFTVGDGVLEVSCDYGCWWRLIRSHFWQARLSKPPLVLTDDRSYVHGNLLGAL